ncbi:MAG: hypothetical protein HY908_30180 [Myxococcales bacterium]|nr:hypothetical protein [Myxococcales bacterium]
MSKRGPERFPGLAWALSATLTLPSWLGACRRKASGETGASASATSGGAAAGAGDLAEHRLRTADGRERSYLAGTAPASAGSGRPLLLVLHGGGGSAEGTVETTFTPEAARAHGFVVAYPEGLSERVLGKDMATWNTGRCCGKAAAEGVDDVSFLAAVVDELATAQGIDRRRVFATGISNGAMMAMRLACERPDLVAGISAVGGPGYTGACAAPRPVAVQLVHGTADPCALYGGGAACGGCWERASAALGVKLPERHFSCESVAEQAAFWRRVNGCGDEARPTHERGTARCVEYTACTSGKPVSVCTIEGGGHTWPGGVRGCDERSRLCRAFADATGPISADLDANATMAAFFLR